jgi:cell wall-associated NlpC family hydrolase
MKTELQAMRSPDPAHATIPATIPATTCFAQARPKAEQTLRLFAPVLIGLSALLLVTAQAEPARPDDEIERPGSDLGFLDQTVEIRQRLSQTASDLVLHASRFLGVPYRRGGISAEQGFDCSGFVRAMYEQTFGAILPRRARDQAEATQKIERQELRPGDLVFFDTMRQKFSHVGIYIGDNQFIHSPKPGQMVEVQDMQQAYWNRRFTGARRVPLLNAD